MNTQPERQQRSTIHASKISNELWFPLKEYNESLTVTIIEGLAHWYWGQSGKDIMAGMSGINEFEPKFEEINDDRNSWCKNQCPWTEAWIEIVAKNITSRIEVTRYHRKHTYISLFLRRFVITKRMPLLIRSEKMNSYVHHLCSLLRIWASIICIGQLISSVSINFIPRVSLISINTARDHDKLDVRLFFSASFFVRIS